MIIKTRFFNTILLGKEKLVGAEIGVYEGVHVKEMFSKLDIGKIYLVDCWKDYEGYKGHSIRPKVATAKQKAEDLLSAYQDRIVWLPFFSEEAAKQIPNESLDFVYIDANHHYEYALQDIKLWVPKVKQGGIVGGHDYHNAWGVKRAVDDYCRENKIDFKNAYTDWMFIKGGTIDNWEQLLAIYKKNEEKS